MNPIKKHISSCPFSTLPVLCLCLALMMLPQTSCTPTTPKSTHNITITVPEGTQSHGNPNLLCTPTRWTDIAVFFFANYVAHAATIKSIPGMPALASLRVLLTALCLPVSGVTRGVKAIRQRAVLSSTPLETAAKAGALCVVVRTAEWVPQRGDVAYFCYSLNDLWWRSSALNSVVDHVDHKYAEYIRGPNSSNAQPSINREGVRAIPHLRIEWRSTHFLPPNSIFNSKDRKVHGICSLPHGYALSILPARAPIMEIRKDKRDEMEIPHISSWYQRLKDALRTLKYTRDSRPATENGIELRVPRSQDDDPPNPDVRPEIELSSNYNLPKGLIAVFQTLYASATLYQTRGDQIQRYGYAAFGLTVAPYLVMSIINLLGTMLTPDYPCVYLVRSEIMDEASRREGAKFEGMVATLISELVTVGESVEFCIDEDNRMFIRGPRESISQRMLRDANDVVAIEVLNPDIRQGDQNETRMSSTPMNSELIRILKKVKHPTVWISEGLGVEDYQLGFDLFNRIDVYASVIVGSIPLAINGGLSQFSTGHSTMAQRVWTMAWLAVGWFVGMVVGFTSEDTIMTTFIPISPYFAPAIGGTVVVAQMLMSYGRCVEIGEANF